MTDAQFNLLLVSLPVIISALGAMVVSIITARKVQEVKEIVDGPLSVALKSNAALSKRIAELTGDLVDVKVAADAQAVNENREAGKNSPSVPLTK